MRRSHAQAAGEAHLVAASVNDSFNNPAELRRIVTLAAREIGGRVIVVDGDGVLLADSAGTEPGASSREPPGDRRRSVDRAPDTGRAAERDARRAAALHGGAGDPRGKPDRRRPGDSERRGDRRQGLARHPRARRCRARRAAARPRARLDPGRLSGATPARAGAHRGARGGRRSRRSRRRRRLDGAARGRLGVQRHDQPARHGGRSAARLRGQRLPSAPDAADRLAAPARGRIRERRTRSFSAISRRRSRRRSAWRGCSRAS